MGAAVEFIKFISGFLVGYTFIGGGSKGGVSPLGVQKGALAPF
jgi:hypothetical protein